jgi:hypothetical protein
LAREALNDVDACCVLASFDGTDVGPINLGAMRQFLLRRASRFPVPP